MIDLFDINVLNTQRDVDEWLRMLEMEEYTELFHAEGYRTEEDVKNVKDLKRDDFYQMGISKRGTIMFM